MAWREARSAITSQTGDHLGLSAANGKAVRQSRVRNFDQLSFFDHSRCAYLVDHRLHSRWLIRAGEVLDLAGPWVDPFEDRSEGAVWRFNMRGPGSASIWLYGGEDEEPEIYEVTSMQFGNDPTVFPAPPIFQD